MTDPQHNYQRPQQKWVCGRNCSTPCAQGPTKSGRCKTTSDCTPTKRDERWRCTRSALQGGPCETGPSPEGVCCQVHPPCVPRRSQRSQRGIAAGISLAFTVGLLFVLLGLPNWRTHVAPGPLASSHAQLFQSESESQKCTACHYEFNFQTGEWLTAFWVSNQDSTHSMSQRCMNCHQQNFSDTWAKAPHTLPSELTEKLTAELLASASSNTGDSNLIELAHFIPKTTAKLECARCHQEHQGTGHDLTTLTDKQ
ncbi:MAG: hypothetical protein KDA65_16650, partial [Planctomycetaceae bacterium]|nr:hypothetical protein [Planctomycetaceae bacterium]